MTEDRRPTRPPRERRARASLMVGLVWLVLSRGCTPHPTPAPVVIPSASTGSPSPPGPQAVLPRLEKCERTVSWGPGPTPRKPTCRDQGLRCSDLNKAVSFPVCTLQILKRVIDYEQMKQINQQTGYHDRLPEVAVRGYLRRHQLSPRRSQISSGSFGSSGPNRPDNETCPGDTEWEMRLEYKRQDGCQILRLPWPDLPGEGFGRSLRFLCWGDMTVACCASSLVDSDSEVVVYWETPDSNGLRYCVPEPTTQSSQVTMFLQRDEDRFDTKDLR